jgi:hypothetical protein
LEEKVEGFLAKGGGQVHKVFASSGQLEGKRISSSRCRLMDQCFLIILAKSPSPNVSPTGTSSFSKFTLNSVTVSNIAAHSITPLRYFMIPIAFAELSLLSYFLMFKLTYWHIAIFC